MVEVRSIDALEISVPPVSAGETVCVNVGTGDAGRFVSVGVGRLSGVADAYEQPVSMNNSKNETTNLNLFMVESFFNLLSANFDRIKELLSIRIKYENIGPSSVVFIPRTRSSH